MSALLDESRGRVLLQLRDDGTLRRVDVGDGLAVRLLNGLDSGVHRAHARIMLQCPQQLASKHATARAGGGDGDVRR